ncbi:hypothetical protein BD410DRAFT_844591 [Rickenella mellea]|uniref:Uncharacterized protein n=1 Tax=Rickenella mellea TaxID=50990 RepID=A0A4Y7PN12_9AGAM|nr:hypothetical protein BD410DRAFT_844591 [Rickenella mellea]
MAKHPLIHELVDHVEDAAEMTYALVKSTFKCDISQVSNHAQSEVNLAQIRAEIDSVNHQLYISNVHIETLRQALNLSRDVHALLQARHAELLNCANKAVGRGDHVTRLPQEIISHIASFLYDENREAWRDPAPHDEWVKTVYRPASETLYIQNDYSNQIRFASTRDKSAVATDGERLLSVHFQFSGNPNYHPNDVSNCFSRHSLLSTTHRWRELYLHISAHPTYCDIFNDWVAGLPALSHLSIHHESRRVLPTWWDVFVERFGGAGSTPILHSAKLPMSYLVTSGGVFSNVIHLHVNDVWIDHSPSELNSAFCAMHHLITLEISLTGLDITTNENDNQKGVIKIPSLKELTVTMGGTGPMKAMTVVETFECKSLLVFSAKLLIGVPQTGPEKIGQLLSSVHDSFPILDQLFFQIRDNSWDNWEAARISQIVIQNLSFPAMDGCWLLPQLTTLAVPIDSGRITVRALVELGRNRRTNGFLARFLYLKLFACGWTRTLESEDMLQSLLINYHDVEVLQWPD